MTAAVAAAEADAAVAATTVPSAPRVTRATATGDGPVPDDEDLEILRAAKRFKGTSGVAPPVYHADHQAVYTRFFVQEGLLELEHAEPGALLFRLDTGTDSPRLITLSWFSLALKAANVSAATKTTLAALYTQPAWNAASAWLDFARPRLHEALQPVGSLQAVAPGLTSLVTCVMQGNVYNDLKSQIYPLLVLKDYYLALDDDERRGEVMYVYWLIVYPHNKEAPPSFFVVGTAVRERKTLLALLRRRFASARVTFLERQLRHALDGGYPCAAVVQRLGWCPNGEVTAGVLTRKAVQLSVFRLEKFYVDLGPACEFV
ncbi:T46 [Tupaiid betaherpesvirus 1]|uniref:T46 n=1 Tax=Tupaiid herpesvirus 1 (strain 1) TaxID=10397 RepID=Q91TP3_TUHV1|nr:T46 [Tupaiid betaherpesvirus 1]AAK57094.1 T46 [Tupaiid betaherpesvirus 1]